MRIHPLLLLLLIIGVAGAGCFRDVSSHRRGDGSLVYTGEVINNGDPLASPDVVGTFYDAAGNVIARAHANVCRPMPTGVASGFEVALPPGTQDPARVEWALQGERSAPGSDVGLGKVSGEVIAQATGALGETYIYGEIRNDSTASYNAGLACVGFENSDGEILGFSFGVTPGLRLLPGETEPFQAVLALPQPVTGARIYLDALVPRQLPARGEPGDAVRLPSSSFRNARAFTRATTTGEIAGQYGEVHNNTADELLITVVGTARDADGGLRAVSEAGPRCHVTAKPGSFTFGSYSFAVDGSAPEATVTVEGLISEKTPLSATDVKRSQPSAGVERVVYAVKNTSQEPLLINTCVGAYDSSGKVVGMQEARSLETTNGVQTAREVAPGETEHFTVDVPVTGKVSHVVVIADGQ